MSVYIVSWKIKQTIDNKPTLVDHWQISETWKHAEDMYQVIIHEESDAYCAAISQIVIGTEPQWYEDETDNFKNDLYLNLLDIHKTLSSNGLLNTKRVHGGTDNEDTIGDLVKDTFEKLFNEQIP
jgi:hypothetical protein